MQYCIPLPLQDSMYRQQPNHSLSFTYALPFPP